MKAETLADRAGVYLSASFRQDGADVELPTITDAFARLDAILRDTRGGDATDDLIEGILARGA